MKVDLWSSFCGRSLIMVMWSKFTIYPALTDLPRNNEKWMNDKMRTDTVIPLGGLLCDWSSFSCKTEHLCVLFRRLLMNTMCGRLLSFSTIFKWELGNRDPSRFPSVFNYKMGLAYHMGWCNHSLNDITFVKEVVSFNKKFSGTLPRCLTWSTHQWRSQLSLSLTKCSCRLPSGCSSNGPSSLHLWAFAQRFLLRFPLISRGQFCLVPRFQFQYRP